jgi:hypothetical protein
MAGKALQRLQAAADRVLVPGEHITSRGYCWAVQCRSKVPLLFAARRQYVMVLTDRRLLLFTPSRRGPGASDLVIAKRYETFTLESVRRVRPLMQVCARAANGNRMVFEFRANHRELGGELVARLTPRAPDPELDTATSDAEMFWGEPSPSPR